MPERYRSKDGKQDTREILGDTPQVARRGRSGGTLARKIGTRDEVKRSTRRPAGTTRVEGKDERDSGLKENF